jgi:peptidylprolyl isomerase
MRSHIAAAVLVIAVAGACSVADGPEDDGQTGAGAPEGLTVSGDVGSPPEVSAEAGPPGTGHLGLLVEGEGAEIPDGSLIIVDLVTYTWGSDGTMTENVSSYELGSQSLLSLAEFQAEHPEGATAPPVRDGARLVALDPPEEAGDGAETEAERETELVVIDVAGHYLPTQTVPGEGADDVDADLPVVEQEEGAAPLIRVPVVDPPEDLVVRTQIEGDGEEVETGDQVVVQFSGVNWDGAAVFDSTWQHNGGPQSFHLGFDMLVPAWEEALVGATVGSRLLVVAPPEHGYGDVGRPEIGIGAEDTLVYLIDVLGVH